MQVDDCLHWGAEDDAHAAPVKIYPLHALRSASAINVRPNPFLCFTRITIEMSTGNLVFDCDNLQSAHTFAAQLKESLSALALDAATSGETSASFGARKGVASSKKSLPRQSKRLIAAKKLREQLLELNRLRNSGKGTMAAELAQQLEADPPSDTSKLDALAKQRVRELRDTTFSFGGLHLTRRILQRFVDSPEVRPLLNEDVLQKRQDAIDGETARVLIKAAKAFFGELLKAPRGEGMKNGGRRNNEDRNAHAAALAALLPADLFENRRGRAAMRLLGLSYKQTKCGAELRAEMEDRGYGWKRLNTSEHCDKVYKGRPSASESTDYALIFIAHCSSTHSC